MANKNEIILRERFKNSIRRGTGEAILIMKRHPEIDFSREIVKGSTKYLGYDPQCESGRDEYFALLIDLSPKKNEILKKIITTLANAKATQWDYGMSQLNHIVACFAKKGNVQACQILYQLIRRNLGSETALIEIDGIDALKAIVEIKGKLLLRKNKSIQDDWTVYGDSLIKIAENLFPGSNPKKELTKEAKLNPFIKRYLDEIAKIKEKKAPSKEKKATYILVKKMIDKGLFPTVDLCKRLSKMDLNRMAVGLQNESDPEKQFRYLVVFTRIKFPLGIKPLIPLATSYNRRLTWQGIRALSLFKNEDVRKLALDKLKTKEKNNDYLKLLERNFRKTDNRYFVDILKRSKNAIMFHNAGSNIIDIYERNKTKGCLDAMMEIYNRGTCSGCRHHVIDILRANKILPSQIKKEMKFDCYYLDSYK